jgi:hypothetical protein
MPSAILLPSSGAGPRPVVIVAQQPPELHVHMHGLACLSCISDSNAYLTMSLMVRSRPHDARGTL